MPKKIVPEKREEVSEGTEKIRRELLGVVLEPYNARVLYALSYLSQRSDSPAVDDVRVAYVTDISPISGFLMALSSLQSNGLVYGEQKDSRFVYGLTPLGKDASRYLTEVLNAAAELRTEKPELVEELTEPIRRTTEDLYKACKNVEKRIIQITSSQS